MFIEELVIDGFKSYSTKVHVGPFDQQFNAITGLNGTGKSNILDSICFVLGISNLSQVRVGNLSELVYKQGQAGVTKASVTVVFNNEDKQRSPVGYEDHTRITITRQIVIGGRNRYLLNSHNVQQNQIQNLFHSVSLNVNNPHFLIMQGRITKVINMKAQETLGMIEEAAGTRMYENKKTGALRTMEKKQNKVDEINRLLAEEITPTLEKLQKERANYLLWVSNNNEVERLTRFCIAFEYLQVNNRLENKNQQLEEMEGHLQQLGEATRALEAREKEAHKEMKERTATRDVQSSKELKKLEDLHSKLAKEVAKTESMLKNRQSDLEGMMENQKQGQTVLAELHKQVEAKEKASKKQIEQFDALTEQEASIKKEIEKAQWNMQALTAGMSAQDGDADAEGAGKSVREQLLEAQTQLSNLEADGKKKTLAIHSLTDRIGNVKKTMSQCQKDGKQLSRQRTDAELMVGQKKEELTSLRFDAGQYDQLALSARQEEQKLHAMQGKLDQLRAQLGGIDFNFADPWRGFDRSKVKGVVAKLFHIQPDFEQYHRALEVCAGGRLFFVVVDNEETGKALLEKGQLKRRVTIIPLNKIVDPTIPAHVVRTARSILPPGGDMQMAYEIVGFEKEVQSAMKYVFGGYMVCDTPETAKQVTFHPNVRVRTVTKDGDLYDPAGTITGGSAPKGGNLLMRLSEAFELEKTVQAQHRQYDKLVSQLQQQQAMATRYKSIEREVQCKEHELKNIEETINRSEHHSAEQSLNESQAQVKQLEEDIRGLPEEKKRLEKLTKQLEKDIKSLESSREERTIYFEQQVEKLKVKAKQGADKIAKTREVAEQAKVELEVLRNEIAAQQANDHGIGQGGEGMAAEVQKLKDTLAQRQEGFAECEKKLEEMKANLQSLDKVLADLAAELTSNKQQKEEKELEHKRICHKIQQVQKDDKEAHVVVQKMEQQHPWIEKEKNFFGKKGTDFDFEANSYQDNKHRHDELNRQQSKLSKNINKKAMVMFDKAEQEYKDLLLKRDIILNDKKKIESVIKDLDEKKLDTLRRTWVKVNKDFDSIFGALLPNANAKLEPPEGMDATEGLEIKIAFGGTWKQSLSELSGGQRSLLSLSLVLALLLFKPAPMYILDEIDSALDLSHTQNIGHMIRTHFPHSQFIVVSLKEGLFNHANCLFRTRFVDGTSQVARYAVQEGVGTQGKENAPAFGERAGKKQRT